MSDYQLFKLKYFNLYQNKEVFKIGTDALVLGAWANPGIPPNRILDLGTGTGILSLMMAQKFPNAEIIAIDSCLNAVSLADFNFKNNPNGMNCRAEHCSFENFLSTEKFDLIISNPPYFVDDLPAISVVNKNSKHLTTNILKLLFKTIKLNLTEDGLAILIHPTDPIFQKFASLNGLSIQKQLQVYGVNNKMRRICSTYSNKNFETTYESLVIRNDDGQYTESYKNLTREFHGISL